MLRDGPTELRQQPSPARLLTGLNAAGDAGPEARLETLGELGRLIVMPIRRRQDTPAEQPHAHPENAPCAEAVWHMSAARRLW